MPGLGASVCVEQDGGTRALRRRQQRSLEAHWREALLDVAVGATVAAGRCRTAGCRGRGWVSEEMTMEALVRDAGGRAQPR
jgi:hypothetical protein